MERYKIKFDLYDSFIITTERVCFTLRLIICAVILSAFLNLEISGQVPFFGRCPSTTPQANFDLNRYLGRWFEIRSYPAIFQLGGACTQARYSLLPNSSVLVQNSMIRFGRAESIEGNAVQVEPGKLIVNFPSTPSSSDKPNYIVLGTDYENFAVVHSCTPILFGNFQFAWVLSRNPTISRSDELAILEILRRNGVSRSPFSNTRQTNCPAETSSASRSQPDIVVYEHY
jgi:apolipoprotein D and lipocalin family protein